MYRHSPVRNQRSKGLKTKHIVQLCLLIAVCFWLLFQLKRSHDNNKHFDATISHDETLKFGRKDLLPKLEKTTTQIQMPQDQDNEENKHGVEEEDDEDKIEADEIDEKSNMEIDRDEVDIIDDDKETDEGEEKDDETEPETRVEDDKSTHEAREEHYKADDASSAVITHNPENGTLDDNSSRDVDNATVNDSEPLNAIENPHTTAPSSNATPNLTKNSGMLNSNGEQDDSKRENLEINNEDPSHLEVQYGLEMPPELETDTVSE